MDVVIKLESQWLTCTYLSLFFIIAMISLCLFYSKKRNQNWDLQSGIVWILILYGGIETVYGLLQIYNFMASNHSFYKLTGTFFNPGPYSGYLAMIFPLCLNEYLQLKNKKNCTVVQRVGLCISGVTMLLIICVLPAGMSRSAWIAAIVSGLWVCGMHYLWGIKIREMWNLRRYRVLGIVGVCMITFCILGIAMFNLKQNSANGRFFMWKIACMAVVHKPLGYGTNGFAYAYGRAQEEYFAKGDYSLQEELVAGSPEYAFNEYLQIAIERGSIVLLLILLIIGGCLRIGMRENRISACGGVISLLIFAFSSYPMQIPVFVVSFIFLLAACVLGHSWIRLCLFALLIGVMSFYVERNNVYSECKEWESAQMLYNVGAYKEAKIEYKRLYPALKNMGAFLYEYGYTLYKLKEYSTSIAILQKAAYYSCDPMILNIIGKNYQQQEKYSMAEKYFIRSTHRLPGRIYPYYLLAKLYAENGATEKMQKMAGLVLTKEPKVQSVAIKEMRREMVKLIK